MAGIVALLVVPAASAALSQEWSEWRRGPAQFLMTQSEEGQWQSISTDADAKAFVDLFWARRDPTPDTPANEFRANFDARVKYADEHFNETKLRGSLTDRGKVLILIGPPVHATLRNVLSPTQSTPPVQSEAELQGVTPIGHTQEQSKTETWAYEGDKVPPFAGKRPFDIVFITQKGSDEFRLGSNRVNVPDLFAKAVKAAIVSPDLTVAPTFKTAEAAPPEPEAPKALKTLPTESLRAAAEAFGKGGEKPTSGVYFTSGEYVTSDGVDYVAVQLYLPAAAASMVSEGATFFGQVVSAAGDPQVAWEDPATEAGTSGEDRWLDRSLVLEPGDYKVAMGIARDGKVEAIVGGDVKVEAIGAETPGTSMMILSNRLYPLETAQAPTDPFAFGGVKVVPKGDDVFTTKDELWYFIVVRHPGVGEDGSPAVQVKLDVEGKTDEKKSVHMGAPMAPASLMEIRGVPGQYGVGTAIPLATFKPGTYTLKVRMFDSVRKETTNFEKSFRIVG